MCRKSLLPTASRSVALCGRSHSPKAVLGYGTTGHRRSASFPRVWRRIARQLGSIVRVRVSVSPTYGVLYSYGAWRLRLASILEILTPFSPRRSPGENLGSRSTMTVQRVSYIILLRMLLIL